MHKGHTNKKFSSLYIYRFVYRLRSSKKRNFGKYYLMRGHTEVSKLFRFRLLVRWIAKSYHRVLIWGGAYINICSEVICMPNFNTFQQSLRRICISQNIDPFPQIFYGMNISWGVCLNVLKYSVYTTPLDRLMWTTAQVKTW